MKVKKEESGYMDAGELIEKYGKRYAFEWFVRAQDDMYYRWSISYIDKECKKITALAATNAVITVLLIALIIWKF